MDQFEIRQIMRTETCREVKKAREKIRKLQLKRKQPKVEIRPQLPRVRSYRRLSLRVGTQKVNSHVGFYVNLTKLRKRFIQAKGSVKRIMQQIPSLNKQVKQAIRSSQLLSQLLVNYETKEIMLINDSDSYQREQLFFKQARPKTIARLQSQLDEMEVKLNHLNMSKKYQDDKKLVDTFCANARDLVAQAIKYREHKQRRVNSESDRHQVLFNKSLISGKSVGLQPALGKYIKMFGTPEAKMNYVRYKMFDSAYEMVEQHHIKTLPKP